MSDTLRNPGQDDYFTCPQCLTNIPDQRQGVIECPGCSEKLLCTVEQQPVSVCTSDAREIADWLEENEA